MNNIYIYMNYMNINYKFTIENKNELRKDTHQH